MEKIRKHLDGRMMGKMWAMVPPVFPELLGLPVLMVGPARQNKLMIWCWKGWSFRFFCAVGLKFIEFWGNGVFWDGLGSVVD